jgi:hypothetical protein
MKSAETEEYFSYPGPVKAWVGPHSRLKIMPDEAGPEISQTELQCSVRAGQRKVPDRLVGSNPKKQHDAPKGKDIAILPPTSGNLSAVLKWNAPPPEDRLSELSTQNRNRNGA